MTETTAAPRTACPACGATLPFDEGDGTCAACRTELRIARFRPVLDAAALDAGEGRCLNHPGKDAVDACTRCGGYLCDVCVTRTGEHVLCPSCFDVLHERGELETTRNRRWRWDHMCFPVLVVSSCACGPAAPLALFLAVFALWRRRKEPWLSIWPPILTIALFVVPALAVAVIALVEASR